MTSWVVLTVPGQTDGTSQNELDGVERSDTKPHNFYFLDIDVFPDPYPNCVFQKPGELAIHFWPRVFFPFSKAPPGAALQPSLGGLPTPLGLGRWAPSSRGDLAEGPGIGAGGRQGQWQGQVGHKIWRNIQHIIPLSMPHKSYKYPGV